MVTKPVSDSPIVSNMQHHYAEMHRNILFRMILEFSYKCRNEAGNTHYTPYVSTSYRTVSHYKANKNTDTKQYVTEMAQAKSL